MRVITYFTKEDFTKEVANGRNGFTIEGAAQLYDHLDYSTYGRYEYEGSESIEECYKQLTFNAYDCLSEKEKTDNTVILPDNRDYAIVRTNSCYI